MPAEDNENRSPVDSLQDIALGSWRFARLAYNLLVKGDAGQRGCCQNQVRLSRRTLDGGIAIDIQRWAPQDLTAS
jgi:hypothetical protein